MALIKKFIKSIKKIFRLSSSRKQKKAPRKRRPARSPAKKFPSKKSARKTVKAVVPKKIVRKKKAGKTSKKSSVSPKVYSRGKQSTPQSVPQGIRVGEVTHYFSKIQVCVIKVSGGFKVGDRLHIKSGSVDFIQPVKSLQVESVDVPAAKKGQLVGLKVNQEAKEGAEVYKL